MRKWSALKRIPVHRRDFLTFRLLWEMSRIGPMLGFSGAEVREVEYVLYSLG